MTPTLTQGVVGEFDEERGYGTVRADDGRELFFHCTSIAGGTRTIASGTRVWFRIVAGHQGRWEAASVTPQPLTPAPDRPPRPT